MSQVQYPHKKSSLIKFNGTPNSSDSYIEFSRWKQFKKFIFSWGKEGGILISKTKKITEEYYTAEVHKKENEALKFAEEAKDIAAQKDLKVQEKVKIVNDEIERIFSDGVDFSNPKTQLQLANLISNNPDILQQLNKISSMITNLKLIHGTNVEIDPTTVETQILKPGELGA